MITLPQDVHQGGNWSGTSTDHGRTVRNLESLMSWPEHQRIVVGARGLLVSLDYPQKDQDENLAKKALVVLKEAYTTSSNGVLYGTKGIHQPYLNPHMQLTVEIDATEKPCRACFLRMLLSRRVRIRPC
jgi:hypothetical protein